MDNNKRNTSILVKEHLSLSASILSSTLLLMSDYSSGFLQYVLAALIAAAVVRNHILCRKLQTENAELNA